MPRVDEILAKAADLVEQGWCQGAGGRDACGNPIPWTSPRVTSFCARGAIARAAGADTLGAAFAEANLRDELERMGKPRDITGWNDTHGRKADEVANVLRTAAAYA